ncbi:MAG: type III polyketide synthase [Planctomycetia bacterium]
MRLAGWGTALPPHGIPQADAALMAATFCDPAQRRAALIGKLYQRSMVERRHSVVLNGEGGPWEDRQSFYPPTTVENPHGPTVSDRMKRYEEEAPGLAAAAARVALADADLDPARVTHLVTVSCTGFYAPGVDFSLITALDLPPTTARVHVGFMGCHGLVNGLRTAQAFTAADPSACVLTVAVELCSLHLFYGWEPEKIVANALFADGAAAVVGVAADKIGTNGHDSAERPWRLRATGSRLLPGTADMMSWKIRDHGFEMTLSAKVPDAIQAMLKPWLAEWLASNGVALEEVASWAVHPGGPRILSAVEQSLSLDADALAASRGVLASAGNMSSPTILFILDRLRATGAPRPCVALGFGPGLVAEAALFV